ncbi:hypothetical protein EV714DRAFT_271161 [Schizophyllum commune]
MRRRPGHCALIFPYGKILAQACSTLRKPISTARQGLFAVVVELSQFHLIHLRRYLCTTSRLTSHFIPSNPSDGPGIFVSLGALLHPLYLAQGQGFFVPCDSANSRLLPTPTPLPYLTARDFIAPCNGAIAHRAFPHIRIPASPGVRAISATLIINIVIPHLLSSCSRTRALHMRTTSSPRAFGGG